MAVTSEIAALRSEIEALRRETAAAAAARAPSPPAADPPPKPAPEPDAAAGEADMAALMQKLMSQFGDTLSSVESEIQDHPQASVAAAFGLGIVVGMLIAR
jgi:hypothetical protein